MGFYVPDKVMRWLGPAIIILLGGFVIFGSPFGRQALCTGADNEHCFRDWASALGGWAAVVIAAPTLYVLWRQVGTAQMQAQDTFKIQLRRTISMAHKAQRAAEDLHTWPEMLTLSEGSYASDAGWEHFKNVLRELKQVLDDPIFDAIEAEIDFPTLFHAKFLREFIGTFEKTRAAALAERVVENPVDRSAIFTEWSVLTKNTSKYAAEIQRIVSTYREECQEIIRKYD